MTKTNCCSAQFSGLKTAHCSACHETFSTVSAFDKHRAGSYAADTRRCLPPTSVGLVSANRSYPCWGYPPKVEEAAA
ncbi:FDXHR family putative zinc-binding protein [Mycolicibacterium elephantis]